MSDHIEYLSFKGIEKKEQILFKSFLNLAKNDLAYQIIVLKANDAEDHKPGIVIIDENYSPNDQDDFSNVQSIIVGSDLQKQSDSYIVRPAQWSDFKSALSKLTIVGADGPLVDSVVPEEVGIELEQSDSENTEFASVSDYATVSGLDEEEQSISIEEYSEDGSFEEGNSEEASFETIDELDEVSAGFGDVTSDDQLKIADNVIEYNNNEDPEEGNGDAFILRSDDESGSVNSVLVIETNSLDAWDFNELELEANAAGESASDNFSKFKKAMGVDEDTEEVSESDIPTRSGNHIGLDEEYWTERNEIIANGESFLYFMPDQNLVYSTLEPGKWPPILKRHELSKSKIADDWTPEPEMKPYPLDTFRWTHILVTDTEELYDALDEEGEYMLESWPSFDLLELDNILLKLCAMLFVRPETMASLANKSGYGLSTVCGLMNACHEFGLLKIPSEISSGPVASDNEEGMLGKIRDAFR